MTDWPVKTLGEVAVVGAGNSAPQDKKLFKNGVHRFVRTSDVGQVRIGRLDQSADLLNDEGTKGLRKFRAGVTLMPKSGASTFLNHRVQLTKPCFVSSHLAVVDPNPKLMDDTFMFYFLQTVRSQDLIQDQSYPSLNLPAISGINVLVPPLDEQKRLVALLDAATARITELTACYELASSHTKLLSGSMLVKLLTSVEDSEPMRLGVIAELKGRIGWRGLTAKEYTKEGPLFVSVHSLNYGHYVDLKDAFHISQDRYDESPEIMLKNNDILICKDGAGIGKLGMVGQLPGPATINSSLLLIRASKKVRSEFLYFYLLSPIFQNLVQERLSGSTTPHLYQRDIAELVIELPSLETQDHLIKKMWGALGRQGDLVECFDKQIGAMMRMRQSILEAAFAGDL